MEHAQTFTGLEVRPDDAKLLSYILEALDTTGLDAVYDPLMRGDCLLGVGLRLGGDGLQERS